MDDSFGDRTYSNAELGLADLDAAGFPAAHPPSADVTDLASTARIDPEDIVGEMTRISADLAYWNATFAEAHRAFLLAELDVKRAHALLYLRARQAAEVNGYKATEATLESTVTNAPEYHAAKLALIEAEAERERLLAGCKTLAAKKDMLISIGNRYNAELRADPLAVANSRRNG